MPQQKPTIRAPYGVIMNSAAVPMATPPARVAFWMCTCQGNPLVSDLKYQEVLMPPSSDRVTMSSLPRLSCMLESATVVRTQEARPRYVLMAALCCPSPWSVMAELKLGQNIQRNRVPVRRKQTCEAAEKT